MTDHVAAYHGLLGTVVEVHVRSADDAAEDPHSAADAADAAERVVVDEIRRLERVFSVYDPASVLVRWRTGALDDAGPELGPLLAAALAWQARSGGAFNPMTGLATQRWRTAEADGVAPTDAELDALAAAIRTAPYRMGPGGPERTADCAGLDLNAFAKGHIVDRALATVEVGGAIERVLVNAGGDLAHRGRGAVGVGIENPFRPFDNEPPLAVVALERGALATSGGARRGFRVGGERHSHVLDPRTARPVRHVASVTVLAPDAATADVVATVAGVLPVAEGLAFVDALDGVACLVVDVAGRVATSDRWPPDAAPAGGRPT